MKYGIGTAAGRTATASFAAWCLLAAGGPAAAQATVQGYAAACGGLQGGGECVYGASVQWTPPNGATVGSSVSHHWQYVDNQSPEANYSYTAAAQVNLSGVDKWSAYSSVGGYINASFYGRNGASGSAYVKVEDQATLPQTPYWQGPGTWRLTYRLSGSSSVAWALAGTTSDPNVGAHGQIQFGCSVGDHAGHGSACSSPDLASTSPGSGLFNVPFDTSQTIDRTVSFDLPVFSDQSFYYGLTTTVSSVLYAGAGATPIQLNGGAVMDFSHTFTLVGAELYDASFNPVAGWTATAASGFDYATLGTPVPEPANAALFGAGLLLLGGRRIAKSRAAARGPAFQTSGSLG